MVIRDPLVPGEPTGSLVASDLSRVVHSHHYNAALMRALLEAERIDAREIVERAAAELAVESLADRGEGEDALHGAEALFRESGLGRLDLSRAGRDGGEVRVHLSHFALGWRQRYGASRRPVCAMPAGYLAGAFAVAFGRRYDVAEVACAAQGAGECRFRLRAAGGEAPAGWDAAQGGTPAPTFGAPDGALLDEEAVVSALLEVAPTADPDGRIPALGVMLTRLWSDFYNRVSYRFEREVPRALGAKFSNLPALVLTEAGHSYAFHTLGGLLASPEWRERVVPLLRSREHWFHAAVALVNALGWGTWRVHALVPGERVTVRVYDGYEALGYRRHFGFSDTGRCYLARGTVAALMNLLYVGDITTGPALTPTYYNQLFRSPLSFRAVETRCRTMDDPYCEFIANPLSPSLSARAREQG